MSTGRVYLDRGHPITVLTRWRTPGPELCPPWLVWAHPPTPAPRNVLIERADGSRVVRPFRGLRRAGGQS